MNESHSDDKLTPEELTILMSGKPEDAEEAEKITERVQKWLEDRDKEYRRPDMCLRMTGRVPCRPIDPKDPLRGISDQRYSLDDESELVEAILKVWMPKLCYAMWKSLGKGRCREMDQITEGGELRLEAEQVARLRIVVFIRATANCTDKAQREAAWKDLKRLPTRIADVVRNAPPEPTDGPWKGVKTERGWKQDALNQDGLTSLTPRVIDGLTDTKASNDPPVFEVHRASIQEWLGVNQTEAEILLQWQRLLKLKDICTHRGGRPGEAEDYRRAERDLQRMKAGKKPEFFTETELQSVGSVGIFKENRHRMFDVVNEVRRRKIIATDDADVDSENDTGDKTEVPKKRRKKKGAGEEELPEFDVTLDDIDATADYMKQFRDHARKLNQLRMDHDPEEESKTTPPDPNPPEVKKRGWKKGRKRKPE